MEIEQRYMVSYLHRKEMRLPAIVAELAAVYHEDAFRREQSEILATGDFVSLF
jgi:hypothetical protein